MVTSVLRQTVHTSLARTLLNEVLTRSVKYYFSYGRTYSWGTETPPDALDTLQYELAARKDTVFIKEVAPNDVALVIPRYNWVSGAVYDDYDDYSTSNLSASGSDSLENAIFYVVTDEFNVYKCINNNAAAASTVKPTGTSASMFQTADNYVWKYMYTIPTYLRNKFLSTTQMPVTVALQNSYYSDGRLEKFTISSKGSGYLANQVLAGTVFTAGGETNYRIITGQGTSFTTALQVGDYVMINSEVRVVASIQSDTQFTIRSQDPLLYVPTSTNITRLRTYLEITSGDGYKEENPFIVTGVTVSNGGTNYGSAAGAVVVTFSAPPSVAGNRTAEGTATVVGGVITGITVTDAGFGYTIPPKITITRADSSSGVEAVATVDTIKSKAYLEPVINATTGEITNVKIINAGIGYTFTNVVVRRLVVQTPPTGVTYTDASITFDTNVGFINTPQAAVEASAINGAIHRIKIVNGGAGYTSPTVTISGDGVGCTATATVSNGVITNITVTNPGKDYTSATVTINSSQAPTVQASARVVLSPAGGHGKNAIDELLGRTILFFNRLDVTPIMGVTLDVDFRQLCLYKQPKIFGGLLNYNGFIGSTCYRITLNSTPTNVPVGAEVTIRPSSNSATFTRFRVIGKNGSQVLLQSIDNNDESVTVGQTFKYVHPTLGNQLFTVTVIVKPDVEKLQGEVIYIDNRQPFRALTDQPVSVSSRFRL